MKNHMNGWVNVVYLSDDSPHLLVAVHDSGKAVASRESVLGDADGLISVVNFHDWVAFADTADDKNDWFVLGKLLNVLSEVDKSRSGRHADLLAFSWEMCGNRVLDDLQESLAALGCAYFKLGDQLGHQGCETLVSTRNLGVGRDLDENVALCVDVDLQESGFIKR